MGRDTYVSVYLGRNLAQVVGSTPNSVKQKKSFFLLIYDISKRNVQYDINIVSIFSWKLILIWFIVYSDMSLNFYGWHSARCYPNDEFFLLYFPSGIVLYILVPK